ncbi:hypothetical protein HPB51_002978 [Rhipicephalus microplus]|uniref:Uncharacterized protein n=1 Tax=Rhipicephalus microplus TaxID=6941 RepID=A0A9J6EFN0_RHIMP|nr:hypothetical protein HPB51_002978 [Rhipicephalus microplus]
MSRFSSCVPQSMATWRKHHDAHSAAARQSSATEVSVRTDFRAARRSRARERPSLSAAVCTCYSRVARSTHVRCAHSNSRAASLGLGHTAGRTRIGLTEWPAESVNTWPQLSGSVYLFMALRETLRGHESNGEDLACLKASEVKKNKKARFDALPTFIIRLSVRAKSAPSGIPWDCVDSMEARISNRNPDRAHIPENIARPPSMTKSTTGIPVGYCANDKEADPLLYATLFPFYGALTAPSRLRLTSLPQAPSHRPRLG